MRSFLTVAAAITVITTMSLAARAEDSATEKSAPMKGPPNANTGGTTEHRTAPMKGSPNAAGFDEKKSQSGAPR